MIEIRDLKVWFPVTGGLLAQTWDRERLSAETIGLLRADGTAIREHLITAVVPFGDAPELFAGLAAGRRHELQAVLAFDP